MKDFKRELIKAKTEEECRKMIYEFCAEYEILHIANALDALGLTSPANTLYSVAKSVMLLKEAAMRLDHLHIHRAFDFSQQTSKTILEAVMVGSKMERDGKKKNQKVEK